MINHMTPLWLWQSCELHISCFSRSLNHSPHWQWKPICHVNCPNYKNHFHRVVYMFKRLNSFKQIFIVLEKWEICSTTVWHWMSQWSHMIESMWPSLDNPNMWPVEHDRLLDTASTSCPPLAVNPHPVLLSCDGAPHNNSGAWLPPLPGIPSLTILDFSCAKEPEKNGPQTWPETSPSLWFFNGSWEMCLCPWAWLSMLGSWGHCAHASWLDLWQEWASTSPCELVGRISMAWYGFVDIKYLYVDLPCSCQLISGDCILPVQLQFSYWHTLNTTQTPPAGLMDYPQVEHCFHCQQPLSPTRCSFVTSSAIHGDTCIALDLRLEEHAVCSTLIR